MQKVSLHVNFYSVLQDKKKTSDLLNAVLFKWQLMGEEIVSSECYYWYLLISDVDIDAHYLVENVICFVSYC